MILPERVFGKAATNLMADGVAEWDEDLRILYVACTRAKDLLVLSGGLNDPLPNVTERRPLPIKVANSWMAALNERFNLRTGQCLADDLAAAAQPKVKVNYIEGIEPADAPEAADEEDDLKSFRSAWNAELLPKPDAVEPAIREATLASSAILCRKFIWGNRTSSRYFKILSGTP